VAVGEKVVTVVVCVVVAVVVSVEVGVVVAVEDAVVVCVVVIDVVGVVDADEVGVVVRVVVPVEVTDDVAVVVFVDVCVLVALVVGVDSEHAEKVGSCRNALKASLSLSSVAAQAEGDPKVTITWPGPKSRQPTDPVGATPWYATIAERIEAATPPPDVSQSLPLYSSRVDVKVAAGSHDNTPFITESPHAARNALTRATSAGHDATARDIASVWPRQTKLLCVTVVVCDVVAVVVAVDVAEVVRDVVCVVVGLVVAVVVAVDVSVVVKVVVGVVYTSLPVVLNWPFLNSLPPTVTLNAPLLDAFVRLLLACCRSTSSVVLPCAD
jgi:hypothetical protein